jgi:hypothetical protein
VGTIFGKIPGKNARNYCKNPPDFCSFIIPSTGFLYPPNLLSSMADKFVAKGEIEQADLLSLSKRFELILYQDFSSKRRHKPHYVCENEFLPERTIQALKIRGLEEVSAT